MYKISSINYTLEVIIKKDQEQINIFVAVFPYHAGWQLEHFIFQKVQGGVCILFYKLADIDWKAIH